MGDPVSTALVVAGVGTKVAGAKHEAQAQSAASNYNATIAEQNATLAKQNAKIQEEEARLEARRNLGTAMARAAAGGGSIEGSVVDSLASQAMFDELNALTVRHRGELEALGFTNTAKLDRANAKNAKTQGKINMASALLSGGSQLMTPKRG